MSYRTLYLCYFGLREPLVQSQVLPYLREIIKDSEWAVHLITFEPDLGKRWSVIELETARMALKSEGIEWTAMPYHKSPSVPATLYDIFCGARVARQLIRVANIDVIHARVHVPALMGAIAKRLTGNKVKLIFDIRGFFPEEYTDAGNWKENGLVYKSVKRIEKWLFKMSDGFIVLTEKARTILFPESFGTGTDKFGRPVEVIPCCVDLERFDKESKNSRDRLRRRLNLDGRRVLVYVGSLGTWYMADEMADLLATAREMESSTFAMVLTQSSPEIMSEKLVNRGFSEKDFLVKQIPHKEVPRYLAAADISISFIKPCYSKLSSSPTKIAEYLASGLPIITNRGVGDVAEQVQSDNVGSIVEDFSAASYIKALNEVDRLIESGSVSERCRKSAVKRFDLKNVGGELYRSFYKSLTFKEENENSDPFA